MLSTMLAASKYDFPRTLKYPMSNFIPLYFITIILLQTARTFEASRRSMSSSSPVQFLFLAFFASISFLASNLKKVLSLATNVFLKISHYASPFDHEEGTKSLISVFDMALSATSSQLKALSSFSIQEVEVFSAKVRLLCEISLTF